MSEPQPVASKRKNLANILFIALCLGILFFLLRAPEETTSHLPKDENHLQFHQIKSKKEAEKYCVNCHAPEEMAPLSATHPPQNRCLFCHKRD